ncbi:MAG: hypothetical protein JNM57_06765 [Cyclobacteriaceae bacterium]|nr:hypothetical protein [Cyclobacteriaceae bacterium]
MLGKKIELRSAPRWEVQKAKFKVQFPKLTDADLDYKEIEKRIMCEKLEFKLAIPAEELQVIIGRL